MEEAIRCVSHAPVLRGDGERDGKSMLSIPRWTGLDQRDGVPLRLSVQHAYRVERGEVHSVGYAYDIEVDGEMLQFHWHPGTGVDYPPHQPQRHVPHIAAHGPPHPDRQSVH